MAPTGVLTVSEHMTAPPAPTPASLQYTAARVHASQHRIELEASETCGCFFCFRIFTTATIKSWVDANQTALCPHCGIDAVIGSAYCKIGDGFLRRMHQHHFSYRSK
jgi:hypothetical protein